MSKYTPGEWKLAADGTPFVYALNARGSNRMWFNVSQGRDDENAPTTDDELLATARLTRAAPDLLAALLDVMRHIDPDALSVDVHNRAETAIARAQGAA